MARIPYTSQVNPLSQRSNSPMQSTNTNPDAFGASVGRAMQELGRGVANTAGVVFEVEKEERDRKRKEDKAVRVANFDATKDILDLQREVGPDAEDLQERTRTMYMEKVDAYTNDIEDDEVRTDVRMSLLSDLPNVSSRSAQYAYSAQAENSKLRMDDALNAIQNKINLDPTQYDKFREEGNALIDAIPNATGAMREGMKSTWKYESAKRRFDGRINTVKSLADIDDISAELVGGEGQRDWQSEMLPTDYESMVNTLGSMRKTFYDRNNSDARSVLTSLEERTTSTPTLLPETELREAQEIVKRTSDPSIQARMGRLMRDQQLIKAKQRMTPAELRAEMNTVNGNPGIAYPGLPEEVSSAVNQVSEQFGVSASFLGQVAQREYGSEFAKAKRAPNAELAKFKPQTTEGVDLRNLPADVVDAVTLAGQSYGGPMIVTAAAKGTTTPQKGVNIATVGMDGAGKAKVVASLVDAGFTGISEYDNYIQVDMTKAVPASFGRDDAGKVWGGWTYLSPEVVEVLKEKGFAAGADSLSITRAKREEKPKVNYAAPTGIVDENGKPTSSAMGVFQFVEGTWLKTLEDPNVTAAISDALGVDMTTMTKEQILALRGDPVASTIGAAALAKSNQTIIEGAIGRNVTDAELYMAHFLGAPGATTFITAYKNNPDQSAAALLPSSAKANKPVFYGKGKQELTVGQVYANIAQDFTLAPDRVAYEDNKVRKALVETAEKTLSTYPMQHAMNVGSHAITPLTDEGGFTSRGAQARAVADYFTLPMKDMKPFTQDEEAFLKKTISEGTVDENLGLLASIQSMGKEPAAAAMKQLGEKDSVFAHAGDLYLDGNPVVAGDIIRGRKRLTENPAIEEQIGASRQEIGAKFVESTGGSTFDFSPAERQTLQESATALYIERMATGGGNISKFNEDVFEASVQEVLGGTRGQPAIADVNGNRTYLPKGLTADDMETAIGRMGLEDWTRMSSTGKPPRYADGALVDPQDIRDEVMLRSIGGGEYKVMLDDGTYLTTGERTPEGRVQFYIFKPDVTQLQKIKARPSVVAQRNPIRM